MSKRDREKRKLKFTNTKKWVEESDKGFEPTLYKLPKGAKSYRFKVGKNSLDFMPWICSKYNPNAAEGHTHWEMTIQAHNIPTPGGARKFPCTSDTRNKVPKKFAHPCYYCKMIAKLRTQGELDEETIKGMEVKTRKLFCIINTKARSDGMQILETGFYKSFGTMLKDEIDELDEDSPKLDFFHPEDGMIVEVSCKEDKFQGRAFAQPRKISFEPRRKQYDNSIVDKVPVLDSLILWQSEEEQKETWEQAAYGSSKKKGKEKDEDEDDDEIEDEEDDEDEDEDDSELDDSADDDEEDDEEPKRKKKRKEEEDDDDEEDDDSDDDSDDDDSDSHEESDDEDSEEDDKELRKGMKVYFKNGKKKIKGRVKKINEKAGIVLVTVKGQDRPESLDVDEVFPL